MNQILLRVCRVLTLTVAVMLTSVRAADADPLVLSSANFFLQNNCCNATGWRASLSFMTGARGDSEFFLGSSILDPVLQFSPTPADEYQFGESVDLSRRFFTVGAQPGTRGGPNDIEHVFFTADFTIDAPPIAAGVTMFVPYTWSGSLTIASDATLNDVLFKGVLGGTGQASMLFLNAPVPGQPLAVTQIVYGGDRTAPVPEPATAALLGAGLLCAAGVRSWRHARRKLP